MAISGVQGKRKRYWYHLTWLLIHFVQCVEKLVNAASTGCAGQLEHVAGIFYFFMYIIAQHLRDSYRCLIICSYTVVFWIFLITPVVTLILPIWSNGTVIIAPISMGFYPETKIMLYFFKIRKIHCVIWKKTISSF